MKNEQFSDFAKKHEELLKTFTMEQLYNAAIEQFNEHPFDGEYFSRIFSIDGKTITLDEYELEMIIDLYEDTNIEMMASIIDFIKNGPDCDNMFMYNEAIGTGIVISKDWDFFDVMVYSDDKQHNYSNCFSVEIEDFTEVFDFIWDSIDKIFVKTTV